MVAKKARLEKPQSFKSKGNEEQHRFLETVLVELDSAEVELDKAEAGCSHSTSAATPTTSTTTDTTTESVTSAITKAKAFVEKCKDTIKQRQKLIKMADRSEYGWLVVSEYETDELADDENDEKRIGKAIKQAEKKVADAKRKRKAAGSSVGNSRYGSRQGFNRPSGQPAGYSASTTTYGNVSGYAHPRGGAGVGLLRPVVGPCFACHEYGHLRSNCPKAHGQGGAGGKSLYPFIVGESVRWGESERVLEAEIGPVVDECLEEGLVEVGVLVSVKGRLKECYDFWRNVLNASEPILSIVRKGYFLPLIYEPAEFYRPNNKTALEHESFVTKSVDELLSNECVKVWSHGRPHVCSPLLVVVNHSSGKKRLVISLKHLNLYLWKDKFKYEDIRVALNYFEKGGYMCTFDLKSGYHHVDICEESQKYLGFEWKGVYYVFTVLPFGLASACYVFTKLLRPVVKYFREQGRKIVIYVDDGILTAGSYSETKTLCESVVNTLERAGFVINRDKSSLEPAHAVKWLGFQIDLDQGIVSMPDDKIQRVRQQIGVVLEHKEEGHAVRNIASIVGRLISFSLAVGPIARLRTRGLYRVIESRVSWSDKVIISEEAVCELEFWYANLAFFNGRALWQAPSAVRVVYSDASDTGYAGYVVEHGRHVAHGMWSHDEQGRSSTWRELQAVALVLKSFSNRLMNTNVRWFTDNQNVVSIVSIGSRVEQLQEIAVNIFMFCFKNNVKLEVEWLPRRENELADYYSRIVDSDDWGISQWAFEMHIEPCWGPYSVDRFASSYNCKTIRFNSRFWNPGCEAVDAFTVDWEGENNYWCPPVYLICRVLQHAKICKAKGTLIVPEWKSAIFWPLIHDGHGFKDFVCGSRYLPICADLMCPGKRGSVLFKDNIPSSNMLALRIEFV